MKAFLKNYRQAPRKVRLVAGLIKGKSVNQALAELDFLAKRAGFPMRKLLLSAVANAKEMGVDKENLFIKEVRVDKGIVMKRMMPAAMGTGHRINKRTSHVALLLAEKTQTSKKQNKETKEKKEVIKKEEKDSPKKATLKRVSPRVALKKKVK
ncbi:MAG: 50S ribosomal protein L22 [Burkholderiales bacterium]|nr:50S ribosomal protein L22 [Burkholderiales bacterium]